MLLTVEHEVNLHPLFLRHGLLDRVRLMPSGWALHVELLESFDPSSSGSRTAG